MPPEATMPVARGPVQSCRSCRQAIVRTVWGACSWINGCYLHPGDLQQGNVDWLQQQQQQQQQGPCSQHLRPMSQLGQPMGMGWSAKKGGVKQAGGAAR